MRIVSWVAIPSLLSLLSLAGCGESTTPPADDGGGLVLTDCPGAGCTIMGTVATCTSGYSCNIPPGGSQDVQCGAGTTCQGTCGDSCDVDCTGGSMCDIRTGDSSSSSCDASECTVMAGESASYDCTNGAVCEVTMGEGSSASCDTESTCDFVCTSTCSVQCRGDSTCTVQCPGDDAPRDFTGEESCE